MVNWGYEIENFKIQEIHPKYKDNVENLLRIV